mgnify:CR=1 FL=1
MKQIIYDDNAYTWEDAKSFLKETNEDIENYEPTDSEINHEIETCNSIAWDDANADLERFFNSGDHFVLRGHLGLWNGKHPVGACIGNYSDVLKAIGRDCESLKLYDDDGTFCMEVNHHDGTNYFEIQKLTKKGRDYISKNEWKSYEQPIEYYETLWSKGFSTKLHYAKKVMN